MISEQKVSRWKIAKQVASETAGQGLSNDEFRARVDARVAEEEALLPDVESDCVQ